MAGLHARSKVTPSILALSCRTAASGGGMRRLLCFCFLITAAGSAAGTTIQEAPSSPSFGCTPNATSVERIICDNPKLAAEDRLMARLYQLAKVSAFGRGPSNQPAAQREWLKSRDEACAESSVGTECLSSMYAARLEQLALAILFSHPDLALTELRRLDPEAAPMFEAIYLYATPGKLSASDQRRVAALLERYSDGRHWGGDEPAIAVKSDKAFAEFIGVRSAFMKREDDRTFPCAAVVRKPRLLEATAPRFGSNMDNFVIRSDCPDTLPPLPKFTALVEKRGAGMTDCGGGSIRFAYYRSFSQAALAARLATRAQLSNRPVKPFPRRRKVTGGDVSAVLDELAAYYVRYGRAGAREARPLARQMIYNMLEQAWQC